MVEEKKLFEDLRQPLETPPELRELLAENWRRLAKQKIISLEQAQIMIRDEVPPPIEKKRDTADMDQALTGLPEPERQRVQYLGEAINRAIIDGRLKEARGLLKILEQMAGKTRESNDIS